MICLDLSTSLYGHEFDAVSEQLSRLRFMCNDTMYLQQTALKLSGFKKPSYLNNRRIIEKLLDLSKPMGIAEICVQLSLTEIQAASRTIFEQFLSSSGLRNIDTSHPQYAAMAVYQMCRLKKIKIQKTKLISFSHLKSSQWSVLEKSWDTWAKSYPEKLREFQTSKKTTPSIAVAADDICEAKKASVTAPAATIEEYADWRERVLKKAFADLGRIRGN